MKKNLQKIPLIISILLCVFLCIALVFLYWQIQSTDQRAELGIRAWQDEAARRDGLQSLERTLKETRDERALLDTHFAESSDVVPFLDTLEKLGTQAGAKAEVDSVDTGADNTTLAVEIKAPGSFESLYRFLTLLENSPYELEFLGMDIHKGAEASSSWEAIFKIRLLSFIP